MSKPNLEKNLKQNPAILIMGPTASGKTALSLMLAKKLPVEIISVDSAQIYRNMNIGTGKPSSQELAEIPHHLIDIRDPKESYSAAEFCKDTLSIMDNITLRGKIPLLVGGTMLYFRALLQGLAELPKANPIIRARLLKEGETLGWEVLHQRLADIDPLSVHRIHPNDPQRIQRALEVFEITGKPMSSFFQDNPRNNSQDILQENPQDILQNNPQESFQDNPQDNSQQNFKDNSQVNNNPIKTIHNYQIHTFAFMPVDSEERGELHQKIEQRFHTMLKQGLVTEVEGLYQRQDLKDLIPHLPALRAVGYRQVWQYLAGECSYAEMVFKAIVATRQLAKRQITWLRSLQNQLDIKKVTTDHLASCQTVVNCLS